MLPVVAETGPELPRVVFHSWHSSAVRAAAAAASRAYSRKTFRWILRARLTLGMYSRPRSSTSQAPACNKAVGNGME